MKTHPENRSLFRVGNLIAIGIILSAVVAVPYLIATAGEGELDERLLALPKLVADFSITDLISPDWGSGTKSALLSIGIGGEGGSILLRKGWILAWFLLCATFLVAVPLVARSRGSNGIIWFAITAIWILYPTSLAQSVHGLWWNAFESISANAPLIDLLGGLLAGLITGLPLWVLFVLSVKEGEESTPATDSPG